MRLLIKSIPKNNCQVFIDKYHSDGIYLFWPDSAICQYSNATQDVLRSIVIKFMPKDLNLANVPQLRPIETFWAHLGQEVYANGWTADDIKQLIRRIRLLIRKTPENCAKT